MSEILHSGARSLGIPMLFSSLDEDVRERLQKDAPSRKFAGGQLIQQRGDDADGFWLIESGSVAVGQFLPDGEFRGVALLGPGDSYGELALFSGRPRVVDAVARKATEARFVRGAAFEVALAENPAAMRQLLGAISRQLQELLDIVAGIRRGTAASRIAGMLVNLAGGIEGPIMLSVTQQELAELLGLTRATVNSALGDLARGGLIERGYGKLTVLDPAALRLASLA